MGRAGDNKEAVPWAWASQHPSPVCRLGCVEKEAHATIGASGPLQALAQWGKRSCVGKHQPLHPGRVPRLTKYVCILTKVQVRNGARFACYKATSVPL
jgi:hypothetical protein